MITQKKKKKNRFLEGKRKTKGAVTPGGKKRREAARAHKKAAGNSMQRALTTPDGGRNGNRYNDAEKIRRRKRIKDSIYRPAAGAGSQEKRDDIDLGGARIPRPRLEKIRNPGKPGRNFRRRSERYPPKGIGQKNPRRKQRRRIRKKGTIPVNASSRKKSNTRRGEETPRR